MKGRLDTIYCLRLALQKNLYCFRNGQNICLNLLTDFYLTQPSNLQIICFDFEKQNNSHKTVNNLVESAKLPF